MVQRGAGPPPARGQRAALAWLLREGVSLLVIEGRDDAAAWIARLAAQQPDTHPPDAAVGPKAEDPDRLAEQLVAWLPGVSQVGARRLLGHFGSLCALFTADARDIMPVRGFVPRRSTAIAAIARHRYGSGADAAPASSSRPAQARTRAAERRPVAAGARRRR